MKNLLKCLLWLLCGIIVLFIVAYLTAGVWLKTVISNVVPQITKTSASIQDVDISLFRGKIFLKGLKIGNPDGFQKPNAFELGEVLVKFEPKSLFASKVIINEIRIDGTKIDAEVSRMGNMNLMMLQGNIQEYLGNPNPMKPTRIEEIEKLEQKKTEEKSNKAILVKDLSITNSSLDFAFMTQTMNVKLPDFHEKNIGEKDKETLPDLIIGIFTTLTNASFKEISKASQESVNKLLDNLAGRSKEASGFVKGLKAEMKNFF